MTLLDDFRKLLLDKRELAEALDMRIAQNTQTVERLIAQNAADQEARAEYGEDIAFLEQEIAKLSEHEPVLPTVPQPTPSESRREAEELVRERREAQQAASARRQKSKPDAVKAARRAAKAEAAKAANTGAAKAKAKRPGHFVKDPLHVHTRNTTRRAGTSAGIKRVRQTDGEPNGNTRIDMDNLSPTQVERADLVHEILLENGAITQHKLASELRALMDCKPQTAQSIVSEMIQILRFQRRVIYTGQKGPVKPGGNHNSPIWKATVQCTPPELAAAGLGVDEDNYAGTTTRPPDARATKTRITVESSQFEGGR